MKLLVTRKIMQEEAIKASNNSDVPNLVTNLNQSQASDTNSVAYRLAQAAKEKDLSSQMALKKHNLQKRC